MIYVFILLVSPWYMYKGSCFRDVCADTVVVGGYLKGSTGVCIYIYVCIYQYLSILYHCSESSEKAMYFLERASLTGHFGSSGLCHNSSELRILLDHLDLLARTFCLLLQLASLTRQSTLSPQSVHTNTPSGAFQGVHNCASCDARHAHDKDSWNDLT